MAHTRSKIRRNVYKRFTLLALRAVDIIRPYSSRFSKKKYTQRQHVVMLMLKKRLRCSYRELVQLFELMPELAKILKLVELPHFTTLQKQEVRLMNVCYNIYRAAASVAVLLGQRISTKLIKLHIIIS